MNAILLDAGPVIASLDRSDSHHQKVMERFGNIRGRMISTGAVISEAAFFLHDVEDGIQRLVDFFENADVEVWDAFTIGRLRAAEKLMTAYADTPMDFADATLVLAAEHFGTGNVVTLDERGFRTYRYGRNKAFRLLLQDP
jgi:predicted nucleic acid-binding protein